MNEELAALATDLQEIYHWEQDRKSVASTESNSVFTPIEPYCPSEAVIKQNEELVKYQQFAKNFSHGEY
ncbi:MAG: hypothetical protein LBC74_05070, partial [Planctomycetaceae bacterium]|jgi:hypothetical protein|nr:hypothetical protein [Planctomycetaceae bacterium]